MVSPGAFKAIAAFFLFTPLILGQSSGFQFSLRVSFIAASCVLILIHNIPSLEKRFIPYGLSGPEPAEKKDRQEPNLLDGCLNYLASFRVPHSWFRHFYVVSVLSSIFWGHQILTNGPAYTFVAALVEGGESDSATPLYRVSLLWLLVLVQGCRRLYESIAYDKQSTSNMWIGHWIMGIGFYMALNVALWVDSIQAINLWHLGIEAESYTSLINSRQIPTIVLFAIYSMAQHDIHSFLATLPKPYQVPSDGAFTSTLCPHYGYEVFIYAGLAFGWGMEGSTPSMDAVLRFVAVNLFISARQKQKWYRDRFGVGAVTDKRLMFTLRWFDIVENALGSIIPAL